MRKHEDRILFLKEFTKELILQCKPPESEPSREMETAEMFVPKKPSIKQEIPQAKPQVPKLMPRYRLKPLAIKPITKPTIQPRAIQPKLKLPTEIQPEFRPNMKEIDLGKLNFLIKDPRVTTIECPGPEKFILARTAGKTTSTKVSLSNKEIQEVIDFFSKETKIPVISGIFKAAVGNLIITAVISDLTGSRFIITKITPEYMLEQAGQSQR